MFLNFGITMRDSSGNYVTIPNTMQYLNQINNIVAVDSNESTISSLTATIHENFQKNSHIQNTVSIVGPQISETKWFAESVKIIEKSKATVADLIDKTQKEYEQVFLDLRDQKDIQKLLEDFEISKIYDQNNFNNDKEKFLNSLKEHLQFISNHPFLESLFFSIIMALNELKNKKENEEIEDEIEQNSDLTNETDQKFFQKKFESYSESIDDRVIFDRMSSSVINMYGLENLDYNKETYELHEESLIYFFTSQPNANIETILKSNFIDNAAPSFKTWVKDSFKPKFLKEPLTIYDTYQKPYPFSENIENATTEFTFYPFVSKIYEIILFLNKYFYISFVYIFNKRVPIIDINRNADKYLIKQFPGSGLVSERETFNSLREHYSSIYQKEEYKEKIADFPSFCLFSLGYQKGANFYGRVTSIPGSTLFNVRADIKEYILKSISKHTKMKFAELDLKACHTCIFYALNKKEKKELPEIPNLWNSLINQFEKSKSSLSKNKLDQWDEISSWDADTLKSIIKIQWYKGLNGGNCLEFNDKINKISKFSSYSSNLKNWIANDLNKIFSKITVFNRLKEFQEEINKHDTIYLPNTINELKINKGDNQNFDRKIISRLLTSCEIILVFFIMVVIAEIDENIIPINCEADGLLIAGYFEDSSLLLKKINDKFKEYSKTFLDSEKTEIFLEFKNIY